MIHKGWIQFPDLEIMVDPGNDVPRKFFDCLEKIFNFLWQKVLKFLLKKLFIKINKMVTNFPNILRTENADISDITWCTNRSKKSFFHLSIHKNIPWNIPWRSFLSNQKIFKETSFPGSTTISRSVTVGCSLDEIN